ncbi:hypothetical protein [Laspinema olomoucense]|uniref:hypothetical protein n=1 Tax=Laspinema olomoucense TaxID=3231600 RepID=UPI0021BB0E02|nr:hypothetical protein [Laspinema sp. D3d]MCT7971243.1 hypothetical protein [Laspinema sp. D3d]
MKNFTEFSSKNGWLVKYFHYEGIVGESFITIPPVKPPYRSCDILSGWTVTALENWLKELDEATLMVTVLAQEKAPAMELKLFPAVDGFWYSCSTEHQSVYVRVCCFNPHPRLRDWDWEEKLKANQLLNLQNRLALAAKIIWRHRVV